MLENDLKDAIKKAARSPGYEAAILETSARIDQWISVSGASPATHVAWMEQVERLVEAVENLPDDQRTAVELHHLQQCSFKETARRMGKTRSSVTSLVNRGVKAIRKALGELGRP
jgi:RNA polymerase sigma-70 factor (ECF subfamily)